MTLAPQEALVPFHGASLPARKDGDKVYVAVRPICEHLGIAYQAQHRKLSEEGRFDCRILVMVAEDGRQREMLVIERRDLAGWLYGISPKKIGQGRPQHERQQLAALLVTYQRESTGLLHEYWVDGQRPQIQTGFQIPQTFSEALSLAADLARDREQLVQANALMAPKAQAFDAFLEADGTYKVANAAQLLGTGEKRLFELLRTRKVLKTGGESHNLPYQDYVERGLFTTRAGTREGSDGPKPTQTTRITPKGLEWIRRGLLKQSTLLENP